MQKLGSFFEQETLQWKALDGFFDAWEGSWPLDKRLLSLYDVSRIAFDPSTKPDDALPALRSDL